MQIKKSLLWFGLATVAGFALALLEGEATERLGNQLAQK